MKRCRACTRELMSPCLELGETPISNALRGNSDLSRPEPRYPLDVYFCAECGLVQLAASSVVDSLFGSDYPYFSSYSESWLAHCRAYCNTIVNRLGLGPESFVVEVASNDGYLLQYFVERSIPVLGIEPTANTAAVAVSRGIPCKVAFFGLDLAERIAVERGRAELIIANNVLAHVPDLADFVGGLRTLLAPDGTITLEFPHLLRLIDEVQFDTIYHEHYSYFSLLAAARLFERHRLEVYDVDELSTHGGSLRLYVGHRGAHNVRSNVASIIDGERTFGLDLAATFEAFAERVESVKRGLVEFLSNASAQGQKVVGYGAPAKGNTLLNVCGIGTDLLPFTVDRSPHKQGRYLPGSRIPIKEPEAIFQARPDLVLILPWNLKDEIMRQMDGIRAWGGRFVAAIPRIEIHP